MFWGEHLHAEGDRPNLARVEAAHIHHATRQCFAAAIVDLDEHRVFAGGSCARMSDRPIQREGAYRLARGSGGSERLEPEVAVARRAGHRAPQDPLSAVGTIPGFATHSLVLTGQT